MGHQDKPYKEINAEVLKNSKQEALSRNSLGVYFNMTFVMTFIYIWNSWDRGTLMVSEGLWTSL